MKSKILIFIVIALSCNLFIAQDGLVGHWDFNDDQHPGKAVIGNDIIQQGEGVSFVNGPADDDGAVQVAIGTYFIVPHGIEANGGGDRVNEFSLVMDIQIPETNKWYCMYQTDAANQNDGEWFINKSGNMGIGVTGYTKYLFDRTDEWYRIAISVKNGVQYNYYSDGVKRLEGTPGGIDGQFSLGTVFLLFADENGEDNSINVADVKLFSRALSDSEIKDLGGYEHKPRPVIINPYLQTPTPTSVYISWHASWSEESIVEYGTDETLGSVETGTVHVFPDSTRWWHTVKLTNLDPATTYYYKAISDSSESDIYKFKTPPVDGENSGHIRFFVIGDNRTEPDKFTEVVDSMKSTAIRLYGENIEESINVILDVGDIVTHGYILSQYKPEYFEPLKSVSGNIPVMVSIGNHEMESEYFYEYMKYEDIGGAEGEKYYSFCIGRVFFIAINSNTSMHNDTQIAWLDSTLSRAQKDTTIDWIFAYDHHPGHSEIWPDGNTQYVQDRVIPTLNKYSKSDFLFYGHSHNYERGAVQDGNVRLMLSGGAGSNLDRWGMYSNQENYPEIQEAYDHYCYALIDIDIPNKKYTAKTYSLGHLDKFLPNVIIDSFYRDKAATSGPEKPGLLAPESGTSQTPPFELKADDITNDYDIMSSQFQITNNSGDYSNPLINSIRDFEDIYGDTGAPDYEAIDLNKNIDLSKFLVTGKGLETGKTYWWRMRYRDKNLQWSEWSDERSFGNVTSIDEPGVPVVKETKLYANYPNPFNPATTIKFTLKEQGKVSLKIYSIDGRLINTLINDEITSGEYNVHWNGKNNNGVPVPSGAYLYRIETSDYSKTMKALLIK